MKQGIYGRVTNVEDEESIEKMDVPFGRIVGLTAMGLVTGALLRLIYQALRARSKPGQDHSHDYREHHERPDRIDQSRCHFVHSAHSATSRRLKAWSLSLSGRAPLALECSLTLDCP